MFSQRTAAHPHDAITVMAFERVPIESLKSGPELTKIHKHEDRVHAAIQRTRFFSPVLVDQNDHVLDGSLRLQLAHKKQLDRIPILRVHVSPLQARYLHYIVNKSAEFQRWDFPAVDDFLQEHLKEYVDVLEPLGFFGERILPESFFSSNMVGYETEGEGREQYTQEPSVAEWARLAKGRKWVKPRSRFTVRPTRFRSITYKEVSIESTVVPARCKCPYWEKAKPLKRCIGLTGFVTPIVLSETGTLIDGAARLRAVRELRAEGWWPSESIPAFTISCDEEEATLIRMVANRSQEFRRWNIAATETFADENPQLRPLLEPFGLFSSSLLPDSSWDHTPLIIDPPTKRPSFDYGNQSLAQWATVQRKIYVTRNQRENASPLKPPTSDYTSVFEMSETSSTQVQTYDVDAAIREWETSQDKHFGRMTAIADSLKRRRNGTDDEPSEESKSHKRAELPESESSSAILEALSDAQRRYVALRAELSQLKDERKNLVTDALRAHERIGVVRKISGFSTSEIATMVKDVRLDPGVREELDAELRRSEILARMRRIRRAGPNSTFEQKWLEDDRRLARYSKQLRTAKLTDPGNEWEHCEVDEAEYEALCDRVESYFDADHGD